MNHNTPAYVIEAVNYCPPTSKGLISRPLYGSGDSDGVTTTISEGECIVFLGPSGCGKSTLIRLLLGLMSPTQGKVLWGKNGEFREVTPSWRPNAGVVFQNLSLFTHMTALENIRFPLSIRRIDAEHGSKPWGQLEKLKEMLDLDTKLLARKPREMSGGELQRVALARAMIIERDLYVFDEPFSGLDMPLRWELNRKLIEMREKEVMRDKTIIFVTHHQEEAMALGERILIFEKGNGVVQGSEGQDGTPLEIYKNPRTWFAAEFIGSPPINWIPATLAKNGGIQIMTIDGSELCFDYETSSLKPSDSVTSLRIAFRPEHATIALDDKVITHGLQVSATVMSCVYQGAYTIVELQAKELEGSPFLRVRQEAIYDLPSNGSQVSIILKSQHLMVFSGENASDGAWKGHNLCVKSARRIASTSEE